MLFPGDAEAGAEIPRSVALHGRVASRPRIAAYLASRRRIAFNQHGIFRHYPELDVSDPKEKVRRCMRRSNPPCRQRARGLLALEAVLEPLGQKLITARSGEEALRQLLAHDFALICSTSECRNWTGSRPRR